ncbi:MAG: HNH endonuclease signature motif containing protein [Planctomycetota bacterium]
MSDYISVALRQAIRERAGFLCEYCLLPEAEAFFPFEPDHVIALKHGGQTDSMNLACSCLECNRLKGSDIASVDSETGLIVRLFHPRQDRWSDHFKLPDALIVPKTDIGRVTEHLLQLNRPKVLSIRRQLLSKSRHPVP